MRYCRLFLLLFAIVFLFSGNIKAQDDNRKWALEYTGSVWMKPVLTSNPSELYGGWNGGSSSGFTLKGEIFLPNKWHVQAGYFRTEVGYDYGDRTMEGLQVGIKKYFLHPEFVLQPYLLAAGQVNWSDYTEYSQGRGETYTNGVLRSSYTRLQQTTNPRISFLPGAGLDLYLLSSVAFVMEYSFNMGINSHTSIEVSPDGRGPYVARDKGMFHNLSLGVKLTFPFTVTSEDGQFLLGMLWEALFGSLERSYQDKQWR